MFAVIYIGGKQYKVREKDDLSVEKVDAEAGSNLKVKDVLLVAEEDGSSVKIGMPYVTGALVECKIVEHGKGEKIRVVKFKSKKRYSRVSGHRQPYTLLKILKISALEKKASALDKEEVAEAEPKAAKPKKATKKAA